MRTLKNKKGIEAPMKVLIIAFVIGIVVLLILWAFQKQGIFSFKSVFEKFVLGPAEIK